jgi:glycosyltransferase involved in cell wall biosynthesis
MDRLLTLPPPAASTSLVGEPFAVGVQAQAQGAGRRAAVEPPRASPLAGRISLAHDYLLVMRGAERTFAAIADVYADAPIFTLLHDEQATGGRFAGRSVTTSPLQRLGVSQATFRRLLPLYPSAVGRLRLPESDVVLSSSSAFAHGVRVPEGAVHVCYCYTPFRYAWDDEADALREIPPLLRPLLRRQLRRMRAWDRSASARVDAYIAISAFSRERIKRHYGRDAAVIHPPVETHRFAGATRRCRRSASTSARRREWTRCG